MVAYQPKWSILVPAATKSRQSTELLLLLPLYHTGCWFWSRVHLFGAILWLCQFQQLTLQDGVKETLLSLFLLSLRRVLSDYPFQFTHTHTLFSPQHTQNTFFQEQRWAWSSTSYDSLVITVFIGLWCLSKTMITLHNTVPKDLAFSSKCYMKSIKVKSQFSSFHF